MLRVALERIRRREFGILFSKVFLASCAALSSLIALLPDLPFDVRISAALLAVVLAASAWYAFARTRTLQVPPTRTGNGFRRYRLETCCKRDRILAVNELAGRVYPGVAPLPPDRYEQWLMVNPNILTCLFDPDGSFRGYFDVYPLNDSFMINFLDGRLGEHDIRREDILSPAEAAHAKQLYLAGLSVVNPRSYEGGKALSILIWGLLRYLEDFYSPLPGKTIYATGVTPEGRTILTQFQFVQIRSASGRREAVPVYELRMTPSLLELAWAWVPDWSRQCRIGWYEQDERRTVSA